jgi:hypothetical protein
VGNQSWLRVAAGGAVLALMAGCAGGKADVTGKVKHANKPVTSGTVIARGLDGIEMNGQIQADGTFTVQGVTAGPVKFAVISRDPAVVGARGRAGKGRADGKEASKEEAAAKPAPASDANWFALPAQCESPETSGIATTLQSGSNTFDVVVP